MDELRIVDLRVNPKIKNDAAEWFHSKWGVPTEAYLECMESYLSGETEYGWYLCLDGEKIVAGLGVIENDFHDRKDLTPNVCAVYTEEAYRCRGIAGKLLNYVVEECKAKGIYPLYLVTDHTNFYERYGWRFLCMVQGDGEPEMTRMYIHEAGEKLYFEVPSISRKNDAIDFINEFKEYGSDINGVGGLNRFTEDYEGWLKKLEEDYTREPGEERVPARTYFLVRNSDKRIVGMINIRLALNERQRKFGGHIGYSIRPTERGKGYNNINLYLGLKVCDSYGIKEVLMDADRDNPASWKTMEALGGIRTREYYDEENAHCTVVDYTIDVKKALKEHSEYEKAVAKRGSCK